MERQLTDYISNTITLHEMLINMYQTLAYEDLFDYLANEFDLVEYYDTQREIYFEEFHVSKTIADTKYDALAAFLENELTLNDIPEKRQPSNSHLYNLLQTWINDDFDDSINELIEIVKKPLY